MKTVGRYEILREVGRGGMAMVYLARQTDLDRFVALKELGAFHASDPSFAQRFLRESRVAGSLSHPNICTVHDYFEHEGTPYIAMEYIERGSLRPYVGSMNLAQIGGVLEGLLAGLAHGEQHGIVHRDLKPENLMVTSDGRVKIADFGIAKATNNMQTGAFLTATGTTVGTPTYMAPEQAMAQDIGPPTDLYSVGCMAFEMFTGRVPFHDTEAPMAILLRHVNEQIPSVNTIDPKIDSDISDWIDRMLIKDPTKRTQNANDAWDEFEEIIIGLLGPRWRREARLREGSAQFDTPAPLTPAPFQGTTSDAAVSDEFQSFAWGNAVTPDAPPGPVTPPPSESAPLPPEPTVGPPTPPPGPAVAADGTAPSTDSDAGFVTFGAPAAPEAPAEEPPAAEAPGAETPAPVEAEAEAPAAQPSEPSAQPEEEGSFETYIAPAPSRPPTDDAPADAPAIPEPAPEPEPVPAAAAPPPPAPTPPPPAPAPPPPAPAPIASDDDLAATVMPSSVTPPPVEEKPKPKPKEPEPVEPKRERKSGKGVLIGFGIAAVLAAVVGFVAGGGSGGSEEGGGGKPTAAASNADVEALFPSTWKKISSVPEIPGMTFASPIALAPDGVVGGESVVVGQVKEGAANSTLLPSGFLLALGLDPGEVPPREAVQLSRSKLQAYRYPNLRPNGIDQPVTLFTTPTSQGVATVACVDPATDCEAIANTLKLNAGTAFPVGPSKDYAAGLGKTLGALNKKVTAGRRELQAAKTPKAQAAAAKDLSSAYRAASVAASKLAVSPADAAANAQFVSALKQSANAYARLSAAAASGNKSAYAKARSAVQNAEQSLAGALDGLKSAGYKIAGA
ncbi:MAG TPA: serine/threonine-protein kinase [Solirubrobacteraceae bacterium]|nr:serine/threonine-protein kinase [Solirubrobacteraceae bacterium]